MSEEKIKKANARRQLLKGLAAGSGAVIAGKSLPDNWARPVVDSVLLPAHAQTSNRSFSGQSRAAIDTDSQFARVLDSLVNDAQAQPREVMLEAITCIQENPDGTVRVDTIFTEYQPIKLSAARVTVGGAPSAMSGSYCWRRAGLLNELGLISDAYAGGAATDNVSVQVDSVDGTAVGRFLVDDGTGNTLEFNLALGACSAPACPPEPT